MSSERIEELVEVLRSSVLGAPVRLAIMIYLLSRRKLYFSDLLAVIGTTPGNLWSHLKKLEEQRLVKIKRVFSNRPRTQIVITELGISETLKFIRVLKELLKNAG